MHMGGNANIVSLLLQYGASLHAVAQDSTTALHFASQQGHLNVVTQLIKKGARVNVKTSKTWMTPLHMALSKGHVNVAVELIKKGAVQKYNSKGILPLDMVSKEVESSLEEELGNEAMERLRDVQDTPKEVKPPVAFYNRKKGKKNKEVYTEKGDTDNNTQTEINKEN